MRRRRSGKVAPTGLEDEGKGENDHRSPGLGALLRATQGRPFGAGRSQSRNSRLNPSRSTDAAGDEPLRSPEGATLSSPGQRPGFSDATSNRFGFDESSPEGATRPGRGNLPESDRIRDPTRDVQGSGRGTRAEQILHAKTYSTAPRLLLSIKPLDSPTGSRYHLLNIVRGVKPSRQTKRSGVCRGDGVLQRHE